MYNDYKREINREQYAPSNYEEDEDVSKDTLYTEFNIKQDHLSL